MHYAHLRTAAPGDIPALKQYDHHISPQELERAVHLGRIYVAEEQGQFTGWLRYNLFWDNTPFLNLLFVLDGHRGKGYGALLVEYWENQMRQAGFEAVLTSTQSNEYAQHFYSKLGYAAIGGFLPPGEPYELILSKKL